VAGLHQVAQENTRLLVAITTLATSAISPVVLIAQETLPRRR